MNYRMVLRTLGSVLLILAACMVPALFVALIYQDINSFSSLSLSCVIVAITGLVLRQIYVRNTSIKLREGFLIVSLTWILASISGALPFIFSGAIPHFVDALFESASGISTTGSTILADIDALPKAMLFWRSFLQWMGGLGILTIVVAILPALGIGGFQIAKAESSHPSLDKITPKMTDMAKQLYILYFLLTFACIIMMLLGGTDLFYASLYSFSAIATGGFAPSNDSAGIFTNPYLHYVIMFFMLLGGINFTLSYLVLIKGKIRELFVDKELKIYLSFIAIAGVLVSIILFFDKVYAGAEETFRMAFFHVVSIMTTTGYALTEISIWPTACVMVAFLLSFIGGCAGSTSSGIKCIRILIVGKLITNEFRKRLHPRAIYSLKLKGESMPADTAVGTLSFVALFFFIFLVGAFFISLDPATDFDTSMNMSIACLANVGLTLGEVGSLGNYASLTDFTKYFLSFLMILGRLELFTILLLFVPMTWHPDRFK